MKSSTSPLSILLLTEDSGRDADAALRCLLRRLLQRLEPGSVIDAERWEPATDTARSAVRGTNWKNKRHREYVWLRQHIATKLAQAGGFVFFHVDGDRPYAERAQSENLRKFDALVRRPVRVILEGPPRQRRRRRAPRGQRTPAEVEAELGKLLAVHPFYSVEAWYFQNTAMARALCRASKCGGCESVLKAWEADRGALDELSKPKANEPKGRSLCLGASANLELARDGYPLEEALSAGKSLSDLARVLEVCAPLRESLRAARPPWMSAPSKVDPREP